MKKQMFVLFSLFVGGVANAQPPTQSDAAPNPPNWGGRRLRNEADFRADFIKNLAQAGPATVAAIFLDAMQGGVTTERGEFSWEIPAMCVAGVASDSPSVQQLKRLAAQPRLPRWMESAWHVDLHKENEENKRIAAMKPAENAPVEVELEINVPGAFGVTLKATEKITLRRETLKWPKGLANEAGQASVWRIVPPKLEGTQTQVSSGAIGAYALFVSDAEFAFTALGPDQSMTQAKQLALGIFQFLQDFDEKFDLDTNNWREKIMPYVKSQELFTTPGDKAGTTSYSFNEKLANKKVADIQNPAGTVLLYLGKEGKLDYRYNGRATVAFADGHVKMVGPDEKLNWSP